MQTELVPIDSLVFDPANARKHGTKNLDSIKGSLARFGQQKPIVVGKNGVVIAGNGTLEAARALGWSEINVVRTELEGTEATAFAIADNRTGELAEWDVGVLGETLKALDALDFDLASIGFDDDDLAKMLPTEAPAEGLTDPDEVPEDVETRCKPGDLWILGEHRLLCGDSTNVQHVERLMNGERAALVLTDPPYNVDYGHVKHPKFKVREIANDNMSTSDFRTFCQGFAASIAAFADGCIYVFGPPGPDGRVMFTVLDEAFHCSTTIVWNKDRFVLGRGKYHNKYEPCWFGWHGSGARFTDDRTLTNVWDVPRPAASDLHPTMKPVELFECAMRHASRSGDTVLDLFGGSGTTMIASEQLGRKSRLMELDPKYCDVILARWEKFTGQTAKLEA